MIDVKHSIIVDEDGYVVQYENGYTTWSPADVFIKAYKEIISNTIENLIEEEIIDKKLIASRLSPDRIDSVIV